VAEAEAEVSNGREQAPARLRNLRCPVRRISKPIAPKSSFVMLMPAMSITPRSSAEA
jgi:hypothetical protein